MLWEMLINVVGGYYWALLLRDMKCTPSEMSSSIVLFKYTTHEYTSYTVE